MGKIRQGILGGFSGKVGTVVGGNVNGISYMRSLPHKVRDPRTVKQLSQRMKFTLAGRMMQMLSPLLHVGWRLQTDGQSAINAAMSFVENGVEADIREVQKGFRSQTRIKTEWTVRSTFQLLQRYAASPAVRLK